MTDGMVNDRKRKESGVLKNGIDKGLLYIRNWDEKDQRRKSGSGGIFIVDCT